MDYLGATRKTFDIFKKIKSISKNGGTLGYFEDKYTIGKRYAFVIAILTPPLKSRPIKKKIYDKLIEKSIESNKPIMPKFYKYIIGYLDGIFSQIKTPTSAILERLKDIIAGFRLQFFIKNTLKYNFENQTNPDIFVFEDQNSKGRTVWIIHVFGLIEEGLILAHERQIAYIKEQLDKGVDPTTLKKLPPLRTGNTYINLQRKKLSKKASAQSDKNEKKNDLPPEVLEFKMKVRQKKYKHEIEEELEDKTQIGSFGKKQEDASPVTDDIPAPPSISAPVSPFSRQPNNNTPQAAPFNGADLSGSFNPFENVDTFPEKTEMIDITRKIGTTSQSSSSEILHLQETIEMLQDTITKLNSTIQSSENLNVMLKNKIEDLEKENEQLKQQLKDMTENLSKKLEESENKVEIMEQFKEANKILTQNITKLSEENARLKERIEFLENENLKLKEDLDTQQRVSMMEMKKLDSTVEGLISEKEELMEKLKEYGKKLAEFEKEGKHAGSESIKNYSEILLENQMLSERLYETNLQYKTLLEDYNMLLSEKEKVLTERYEYDIELEKRLKQLEEENRKLKARLAEKSSDA